MKLGENFFDFIDMCRVNMVKEDLVNLNKDHCALISLANAAGY